MLKVLSSILCDLDPKVKVLGHKAGICDGVPSTSALVVIGFKMDYSEEGCDQSYCSMNNVLINFFAFPRV